MRYLGAIEPALCVIAFVFGAWRGAEELHTTLTEKSPTPIAIEKFAADYRGQRWLEVRGRLAVEHRQVESSRHEAHVGRTLHYVRLPVVPERWQPADPVQVVGVFGPFTLEELDAWVKQRADHPIGEVVGVTRTDVYNFSHLFPRLRPAASVVYVNSGTTPAGLHNMAIFLGICAVSLVLLIRRVRREVGARRTLHCSPLSPRAAER
jgi:hypothetical protein